MNKQDAFEVAVIELLGQEALLEEKISIYKTASMFWNAACDWQKEQDKDIPMKYKRMEFNAKLQEEIEDLQKERDYWFDKTIEYEKHQTFYKKF